MSILFFYGKFSGAVSAIKKEKLVPVWVNKFKRDWLLFVKKISPI